MDKSSGSIQLIRNATMVLNYGGYKILLDPMFASKGTLKSVGGKVHSPLVDLPVSISEITDDLDLVLLTHTHFDHFDTFAQQSLNKEVAMIYQPEDEAMLQELGFVNAQTIGDQVDWNTLKIIRTKAQHGTGRVLEKMGKVSGFVLQAKGMPTVYIVGDSVWTEEIYQNIKTYTPDYVVINAGGALIPGFEATPIIMNEAQVHAVVQESAEAKVVAVHLDAVDHCYTTREKLRVYAEKNNISTEKLLIPEDGEVVDFD